ncbi:unnamed protein product [Closterium sp. NIES-54]
MSGQVTASGQVAASCSCRSLAHSTVLRHHRLGHPSLPCLRTMSIGYRTGMLSLQLPPSPAPPCGPCVEGRLRSTPHSSSLRLATAPFEALHFDVRGPASRPGLEQERLFLVVVDDYSRYTTVFPLAKKPDVTSTLIRWLLTTKGTRHRRISCLHSDRGATCLPASLWSGSPGVASCFCVWGCLALVRGTSMDKLSPRALFCVFLGFPEDSSDFTDSLTLATSFSTGPQTLRVLEIVVSTLEVLAPGVLESGLSLRLSETLVLGGAGIGGAFPGVATPGGAGAPSSRPGETGTGRVAAGGANSGGDTTGAVESGAGATACSDATPPPHPYPTQHQALLRLGSPRSPHALPSSLFTDLCTNLYCSSPPRPSLSMLPSPPESSLTTSSSTPVTDYYYTYRPILSRILASLVTDPRASLSSVSTLTAAVTDFATTRCLDYATRVVAAPPTRALSIRGEYASGCDAPEDRQFELEFLAAASPLLCAMLLAPEGDSDALDIPTPHTYAEAVPGPWASQWRAAMDAEVASYRSTCTYVDEVPPSGANVVQGMWIFKVKRPPGSPPDFKARYVARGSSQHKGVDFFQTFAPTSKMTTVQVLLHVAAHRDYELHSLDLSTAFLQGSLHKEVWLSRSSGFTDTFPPGTQWRLRRPVCSLR